jgi:formylglycine-generating enzyme required for sulfatase activity
MDTRRFPVDSVRWGEAVEFCRKLSEMPEENRAGRIYRLPTEAEWEYACRGGQRTPTRYFFGDRDTEISKYGWVSRYLTDGPHSVGELAPNPLGLYDMIGNVQEWCQDVYGQEYYRDVVGADPAGPPPSEHLKDRVVRYGPRSSQRHFADPERTLGIGLRVVFTARPPAQQPKEPK